MTRPNGRLVTALLKLLPALGRAMEAHCQLHLAQLERDPVFDYVKDALHDSPTPTQTQMELAVELAQEGPATVRDLARRLGVTPAAVSLLVDRMVEHGWVERERSETDRRVVWVRLTAPAQAMADALLHVQRGQLLAFLHEIPEDEREPFVRNLQRFARVLGHVAGDDDHAPLSHSPTAHGRSPAPESRTVAAGVPPLHRSGEGARG